jgi:hypothetical protein
MHQVIETCILETFGPLEREDRKKNAHMLILGPTGSGKSATVNAMLLHALAVIVTAGNVMSPIQRGGQNDMRPRNSFPSRGPRRSLWRSEGELVTIPADEMRSSSVPTPAGRARCPRASTGY